MKSWDAHSKAWREKQIGEGRRLGLMQWKERRYIKPFISLTCCYRYLKTCSYFVHDNGNDVACLLAFHCQWIREIIPYTLHVSYGRTHHQSQLILISKMMYEDACLINGVHECDWWYARPCDAWNVGKNNLWQTMPIPIPLVRLLKLQLME